MPVAFLQYVNWRMISQGHVGFLQLMIVLLVLGLILIGLAFIDHLVARNKRKSDHKKSQ